jgi:rhodanese-related sulfurtransferase
MEKSFSERVVEAKGTVSAVSAQRAHELSTSAGVAFVDPRPDAAASSTGIIPGALNVTRDDIVGDKLPAALADRALHVITACQGGPMGAIAAHELSRRGFTRVNYVDGGTQGWLNAGFATDR